MHPQSASSRLLTRLILLLCYGLLAAGSVVSQSGAQTLAISRLTTNGRENPLGIPAGNISFSWASVSSNRGVVQQSYQIRVGTGAGLQDVWDSGEIASARQVDVALPSNIPLAPATRYYWQVKIRDANGQASEWSDPAWFETGLLTESDWAGADWITRPAQSPNVADWTNYTATVSFTLKNQAFGIFLRSSADAQNAYMMQVNVTGSNPVFKPHKRTNGGYSLLDTINLAGFGHTNASLTGSTNILQFDVSGTTITTKLNGTTIDTRSGVSFPNGLVGFRTFGSEVGSVQWVKVVDNASGTTLIDRDFSTGANGFSGGVVSNGALQVSGDTDSVFANLPSSLPLLRGKFTAGQNIASARLYASARGLYEVSINGQKAGDQFLAPGWTDYDTRIQSQTYDITGLLQSGENAIGAALADGWHRGSVGLNWSKVYGNQLSFIAKIKITYTDGSTEWFATNPAWKSSDGPFVAGDLQDGENYNANLEQAGWSTSGFDDSQWMATGVVTSVSARLVPQPDEPVREITVLTANSRTEILPGTWLYDLGQNMVGVPRIVLSGTAGQTITIRHAEELYRTGAKTGQIYTDNLRSAKATDTYTFAADGTVTYQPKFTQHGFRYIEITGATTPPAAADVKGVVLSSDMPYEGNLETSHAMLNKLVSNIRWGQRSNFLSIPTDTPARDERLGWTGDINVFAPTAARLADTRAFLSKWMIDVRDSQKGNGNIPAVVPQPLSYFDETGVGWSDAFITIPYSVWRATGDERIIRENWSAMKVFYQFVHNSATGDGDLLEQGRSSWFSGDWLSLESGWNRLEEHKVIGTAYFAENTRMMAEMAAVMGETTNAAQWSALVPQIRTAFVNAYRSPDGSIYQGTQTAYALALGMDMIADPAQRAQTAAKFIAKLAADNNHLRTGFLGTPWLLPALSKIGRDDLAMRLLLNEDYPSWGFPISMGATTMWERWNSIQPSGEFGPVDMNSFNHYAYGAVGDWMFGNLGGIQALEPAYKAARIAPLIGYGGLTSASATQQTAFGKLATEWSTTAESMVLKVEIPANTTARVVLPSSKGSTALEGSDPAATATGVQFLQYENNASVYSVGSGVYVFSWKPPLLSNGGFETPPTSSYLYNPSGDSWVFSGTSGNGSGVTNDGSAFTANNPSAPEGDQVAFLQKTGRISQSVVGLQAGTVYQITFLAANRATPNFNAGQSWEVQIDGVPVASFPPSSAGTAYSEFSATFKATAASHSLMFAGTNLNAGDATVLIDDVRMTPLASQPPTGLIASPGNAQVSLSWQGATGATSYTVKRSLVKGGPYAVIASGITGTSHVDPTVTNGVTYYYVVSAQDGQGGESGSSEAIAIPSAIAISVPNFGFEAPVTSTYAYNPSGGSWAFNGSAGNGSGIATNGSVFTSSNAVAPQGTQVAFLQRSGSFSQTLSGFAPGGVYAITFSAANRATSGFNSAQSWDVRVDGATKASYSNTPTSYADYTATFTASAASHLLSMVGTSDSDRTVFIDNIRIVGLVPSAPADLSASVISSSRIDLAWTASSGASAYILKRSEFSGGPYTQVANVTGTSCSDASTLEPGKAYYYVVSAINPVGGSLNSSEVSATTYTEQQQWRAQYFGATANSGDAADGADPDGDGMTNALEYEAGTNPLDATSLLKVEKMERQGGDAVLTFRSVAGKMYRAEWSDTLQEGSWTVLQDLIAGTGEMLSVTEVNGVASAKRFYRVVLLR
jgi:alpha-L-rhamnosidase